ncbi:hypothetical protein KGQ20_10595 [Catenulispora sp. NF23]|uniref:hypothetical protein n=1 Tax=Catenulispora pinistramenti TaxID=2705254 RepID=UPI001BA5537B|nr:hypothetical protein [Catenulispora pinistramenti]MBS2533222.1 hypothetical protein [Catenulispora pinistramenti]
MDEYEDDQSDGGQEDDYGIEPPVPAGLAQLTAPQRALADFLRVNQDLLKAAAEASAPIVDKPAADQDAAMEAWISGLTEKQKDDARCPIAHRSRRDQSPPRSIRTVR